MARRRSACFAPGPLSRAAASTRRNRARRPPPRRRSRRGRLPDKLVVDVVPGADELLTAECQETVKTVVSASPWAMKIGAFVVTAGFVLAQDLEEAAVSAPFRSRSAGARPPKLLAGGKLRLADLVRRAGTAPAPGRRGASGSSTFGSIRRRALDDQRRERRQAARARSGPAGLRLLAEMRRGRVGDGAAKLQVGHVVAAGRRRTAPRGRPASGRRSGSACRCRGRAGGRRGRCRGRCGPRRRRSGRGAGPACRGPGSRCGRPRTPP